MADSKTILLIEDDADIRDSLAMLLGIEGFRVVTANNGREGLQCLSELSHVDAVLVDLFMPVMGGKEFLQQMRGDPRLAQTPVALLTAAVDHNEDSKAARVLATILIKKPVELEKFLEVVRSLCSPRAAGGTT